MMPDKVQHRPDGPWYPWVSGGVDPDILRIKQKQAAGEAVYVNGTLVFGLKVAGREWNTKEGWK